MADARGAVLAPLMVSPIMRPIDASALARSFASAKPFPHIIIDNFLDPTFANELAAAYPTFEQAQSLGISFSRLNERKKIQITDPGRFPAPVAKLNELLSSPEFLCLMSEVTGIPKLLSDASLAGGGMHITGAHGRLDVHADFNFLESQRVFRRLNILIYLNPEWDPAWGGGLELWDQNVKVRHHRVTPILNRCVVFETSKTSFHGVEPLTCPDSVQRQSFAAYYYTEAPPKSWDGSYHSTLFRARPDEPYRRYIGMPLDELGQRLKNKTHRATARIKRLFDKKPAT